MQRTSYSGAESRASPPWAKMAPPAQRMTGADGVSRTALPASSRSPYCADRLTFGPALRSVPASVTDSPAPSSMGPDDWFSTVTIPA